MAGSNWSMKPRLSDETIFCSTVIPTVARPTLDRAVRSVLEQAFSREGFEVIVVNDSGKTLSSADWQGLERVRVLETQRRERSVARNAGAAIARGRYLHFLDDDDWLNPGALEAFWSLAEENPAADWLYGSTQLVDQQGTPIIQLQHGMQGNRFIQVMAGEWIPLASSLVRAAAFFERGGFNPLINAGEDVDLCRRIALKGEFAGAPAVVANMVRGSQGTTTDYARLDAYSRMARERILAEHGVHARMRASADSSYWRGRITRAFLTSAVWNLQRGQLFTAASRAANGGVSVLLAGTSLFSLEYWRAVLRSYQSRTFARGFQEARPGLARKSLAQK